VKRLEFEYHYGDGRASLPFNTAVVKWFSLNAWKITLRVPLSRVLGTSGLKLMDRVQLTTYLATGTEEVDAFVVSRQPDIYSATCKIGLYLWAPPGYLGGFPDYYNDALNMETRDVTLWTSENGRLNDAGEIESRATLPEKDGGQIETRVF
jgi:hypothetical protein